MANKLTDALAALSGKTKSVEDQIAAARTEAREKLDARITASKAALAAKKENFISKAANAKADAAVKTSSFQQAIAQKVEHLKAEAAAGKEAFEEKAEGKKQAFDVHVSETKYHDAVSYADNCVELAMIALAEVETATLEAFASKLHLEDLKNVNA